MPFNVKTQSSRQIIEKEGLPVQIAKASDILEFCRTLDGPHLRHGSHDLLLLHVDYPEDVNDCEVFIKKGNLLFYSRYSWPIPTDEDSPFHVVPSERIKESCDLKRMVPASACLVSCPKRTKKQQEEGFRVLPLLNADTDEATWEPDFVLAEEWAGDGYEFPMVSFGALSHFYKDDIRRVNQVLSKGQLRLLDFTPEESIPFTDKEKERQKKERKKNKTTLKPPRLGFTAMKTMWHRSGFCLFYDEKEAMCLLTGQDEGSYFALELPRRVETIEEAMDALIPEQARVPGVLRQGEWFFVPCDKDEVPPVHKTVLLIDTENYCSGCESVHLPLDDVESNHHSIQTVDGRVGLDGRLFLFSPSVRHDEHATLGFSGWCTVVKNTALRSYSEAGVD